MAPSNVSTGRLLFLAGRFQRAMTKITPRNDSAFTINAAATPMTAIIMPASPGPTARARLNSIPFSARAAGRSSLFTSSGNIARQVGDSTASPNASASVSKSRSQGVIAPAMVVTARTAAIPNIHISVPSISLRRSKISPMEPAGRANKKNGRADAV
jgi:hypothetical protein